MDICEAFLNTYRDLEEVLATKYGRKLGTVQTYASEDGLKYAEELNLFREMRNLLSHHGKVDGQSAVIPSEASLKKLTEILEYAKNPPLALKISTPREKLCCASLDSSVSGTVQMMEKRGYSHVPVLKSGGGLFGVFSVGTVFAYAKSDTDTPLGSLKIRDLSEYLPPEKHTMEKFAFAPPDATLYDIKQLFKLNGPYHRRVAAVFITKDGTCEGPLLGMITPWDVFCFEEE